MGLRFPGLAAVVCLSLGVAGAAFACTPAPGWPMEARLDAMQTLRTLARAATYVDVAVVERATADYDYGYRSGEKRRQLGILATAPVIQAEKAELREVGVRYHLRVVEPLKAKGPAYFTLNGQKVPGFAREPKRRFFAGPQDLRFMLGQLDLADWEALYSCNQPVMANVGDTVLVFRDAQGRLLQQQVDYRFHDQAGRTQGPVFIPVASRRAALVEMTRKAVTEPSRPASRRGR